MSISAGTQQQRTLGRLARPVSLVILGLSSMMALCSLAGLAMISMTGGLGPSELESCFALLRSAAVIAAFSGPVCWLSRGAKEQKLRKRDAVFIVVLTWILSSLVGALPYVLDGRLGLIDAFFESVSGFTTTGATILTDIEASMSRPLLLWRALTQWIGGMGIIVLFVAIFPAFGIGGKQMFKSEFPGPTTEGLRPRIAETAGTLWKFYVGFTAALIVLLVLQQVEIFDAVCHALTTLSTAGFSTHNNSIAAFESPLIELTFIVFMMIGGVHFALFYAALRYRSIKVFFRSTEFKVYFAIFGVFTMLMAFSLMSVHETPLQALRYALFIVAATISSTGYGIDNYTAYPSSALVLLLIMMFIGGSAGSTAGGIKISRIVTLLKMGVRGVRKSFRPSLVQAIRVNGSPVPEPVVHKVAVFAVLFITSLVVGCLLITALEGAPLPTAFGAMLTCLTNMGPAPFHQGIDNFASYSASAKMVFSGAMILGRLEFYAVLALFLPDFWRP